MDWNEIIAIAAGVLGTGILGVIGTVIVKMLRAKTQSAWIDTLENVIGIVVNAVEAWAKQQKKKKPASNEKLAKAVEMAATALVKSGAPANMRTKEFLEAAIESKLAGGKLADYIDLGK